MRLSSILHRLRCLLGRHEWVSMSVSTSDWPVHEGYTIRKCPDCGARKFNWKYP